MNAALHLLALQGLIGAFDTVYYHEWRAHLPARRDAAVELRIHALRDFVYAALFGSLPWIRWQGAWTIVLGVLFLTEIALTLADFVVERRVRRPLGDVYAGERVTHAVMGIIYGAMLANLFPSLEVWASAPSGLEGAPAPVPPALRWFLTIMGAGVLLSGVRDLVAATGAPWASWPWRDQQPGGPS